MTREKDEAVSAVPPLSADAAVVHERGGAPSEHSPGPWRACHDGECSCGQVWSIPGDMPVFYCHNGKRILVGLANDEWGDAPDMIYGGVGREAQKANARLIAAAPDLLDALLAIVSAAERRLVEATGDERAFLEDLLNAADYGSVIAKACGHATHGTQEPNLETK